MISLYGQSLQYHIQATRGNCTHRRLTAKFSGAVNGKGRTMRNRLHGLRCNGWLGCSRGFDALPSLAYPRLPLTRCGQLLLDLCFTRCRRFTCWCSPLYLCLSFCGFSSCRSVLQRQLYRSGAIQSKLSHRLRVVVPLHNSSIGRNQRLDVPAIFYLISLVHWQTSRSAA